VGLSFSISRRGSRSTYLAPDPADADPGTGSSRAACRTRNDWFTNGDGIFNDRPAGVGRNTLRTRISGAVDTAYLISFRKGHCDYGHPREEFTGGSVSNVAAFQIPCDTA
jgi:hypothetical protein